MSSVTTLEIPEQELDEESWEEDDELGGDEDDLDELDDFDEDDDEDI